MPLSRNILENDNETADAYRFLFTFVVHQSGCRLTNL